ncbi:MAG: J domain-containing protein [Planctomycetes bacterium]|nr:J domain-containing protein [Planctomycetota bacterium]
MQDPLEILGVTAGSSEADIRQAYLQKVREFPPDRAPEQFAQIRAAYDILRNPARLREHRILGLSAQDSIARLSADIRARLVGVDLPTDTLLMLAEGP